MSAGFLARWSRRKRDAAALAEPPASEVNAALDAALAVASGPMSGAPGHARFNPRLDPSIDAQSKPSAAMRSAPADEDAKHPLPSIGDLTPDSDFTAFMRTDVAQGVRAQALRKLFADPHFNTMDRLDTYIDDYGQPDPLPIGWLERMEHARGLVFDAGDEPKGAVVPSTALASARDPAAADATSPVLLPAPDETTENHPPAERAE